MSNTKNFITINPAAEADVKKMNEILQADEKYINGINFTHSELIDDGSVQFFYDLPDEFTPEQTTNARQLLESIYTNFMKSRKIAG